MEDGQVGVGEILAHDRDQPDLGKETGGQSKIGGRAAEHAVCASKRSLDRVKGNRANNQSDH
jgi:hypothetical protein